MLFTEGEGQFTVEVDVSAFAQEGTYYIYVAVELVNYRDSVPQAFLPIKVTVLPVADPWLPPALEPVAEKKE